MSKRLLLLIGVLLAALAFAFLGDGPGPTVVPDPQLAPDSRTDAALPVADSVLENSTGTAELRGDEEANARASATADGPEPWSGYYDGNSDMFATEKLVVVTVMRDETDERIPGARFVVHAPRYYHEGVSADENGMFTLPFPDMPESRPGHMPLSAERHPNDIWTFRLQNGALGERLVESRFTIERSDDDEPALITLRIKSLDRIVSIRVVSPGSEPLRTEVFFQAIGHVLKSGSTDPNHVPSSSPDLADPALEETAKAGAPTQDTVHFDYESHQGARGFRIWAQTKEGYVAAPTEFEPETLPDLVHVQLVKCATLNVTVLTYGGEAVRDIRVESIPDSSMRGLTQTLGRTTNAAGRATFEGLLPIRVNVNVFLRKGGLHTVSGIELQPGEDRELEIRLRDEGPVALTGRVVDENDKPLRNQPIAIEFGGETASAQTNALGEFSFHSDAEGPFVISANRDVSSDTFEPPLVHAQHGTRNITFRRTARVRLRPFRIEVVHAVTLESLGEVPTILDRGPGSEAWAETRTPRSSFHERIDAHTRLRIELEGFQPFALGLAAALANNEPDAPLIVVLEPSD